MEIGEVKGYGAAAHLKCSVCGGYLSSFKHQATCIGPKVDLNEQQRIAAREDIISEFLGDVRVCKAISADCSGGHQEDPCKCLYCRAKQVLST